MSTMRRPSEEVLEILACEIDRRPLAPGPADLAASVLSVARRAGRIDLTFAPGARETVEAFAAAERECCTGIGWAVADTEPILTIAASEAQLDLIASQFLPA